MPVFHYRAFDRSGALVRGTLDCADEAAAVRQLQQGGHVPVAVSRTPKRNLRDLLDTEITPRSALSSQDRVAFTRSLATLLGAGLTLDRGLDALANLGATRAIRRVSSDLLDAVRAGAPLSRALEAEQAAFPPLYRGIVRAGEAGARLGSALEDLADMLEEGARRAGELRSALIYPAFLVVTACGAVGILLAYVVPTFTPLLEGAGVELPPLTRAVVAAGHFAETHGLMLMALSGLALFVLLAALRAPSVALVWHRTLLRLPLLGPALLKHETARMARVLGTMLDNGVALPTALRMLHAATANQALAAEIDRVLPEVEAGRGLARPLLDGGLLPPMALQLLQVGEEAGDLAPMLAKLAEIYATESRRAFDQMLALLTPALTLIMGVLIAVIVSSILYALFSLNALAI